MIGFFDENQKWLAQVLAPLPNAIRVEGYTDNIPIRTSAFYSNWELSAARAGSVVRVLAGQSIDPARLAVVGYGEQRPAASNDTPEGRNANRRVVGRACCDSSTGVVRSSRRNRCRGKALAAR